VPRPRWAGPLLVVAGLAPAAELGVRLALDALGANPVEALTHGTGIWTLRFLLATLAVTPLRQWLRLGWLAPLRRPLGLLAFAYACMHLTVYAVLDQGLAWEFILEDLAERTFIMAGLTSFACLVPLAVTSTRAWMRALGRRWMQLHRLVYLAAVAGVLHFIWLVKADLREPLVYAGVLAALLGARVAHSWRAPASSRPRSI